MARKPWPVHAPGADTRHCSDARWQLMWSHREHLLKVARRRSVSLEDAEDAVHEAMLRAMEHPGLDHERLAAWLTTVTIRLCVDRHRQVNREAEVGSRTTFAVPGPAPVEEVVCDRDEASWLAQRSGELPGRQAEALWLKSEDLDVGQVAHRMGLSYRTVESLLARARRSLRNSLAGTLALALWLCGRGRPRSGGAVQSAAVVSTAATLTVLGLALPGVYDGTGPVPPRPAPERAADWPTVAYEKGADGAPRGGAAERVRSGLVSGPRAGLVDVPLVSPSLSALPGLTSLPDLRVAAAPDVADLPRLAYLLGLPGVPSARSVPPVTVGPGLPGVAGEPAGRPAPAAPEPVPGTAGTPGAAVPSQPSVPPEAGTGTPVPDVPDGTGDAAERGEEARPGAPEPAPPATTAPPEVPALPTP